MACGFSFGAGAGLIGVGFGVGPVVGLVAGVIDFLNWLFDGAGPTGLGGVGDPEIELVKFLRPLMDPGKPAPSRGKEFMCLC